jgi:hypothetical protein
MLLLTDGTVLCHDAQTTGVGSPNWYRFTPDALGSYLNGTWSSLATGPNSPQFFASAVLRDGRVFVAGGEYNGSTAPAELLAAEIYDPVANTWTALPTPAGWTQIGDAICCVLPDGRVLLAPPGTSDKRTAIYDPVSNTWTAAASKLGPATSEESWVLLPDQTVLTCNCFGHPGTEKYVIAADKWVTAGSTPGDLIEDSSKEIGPGVLLADGRVLFVGSTGRTAIYTMPPIASQAGSWVAGPTLPVQAGQQLIAKDAPGCLLPNGKVLLAASPVSGCPANQQGYCPPTYFFEFDPSDDSLNPVAAPANNGLAVFNGRMLLLPTGQVLFSNGTTDVEMYTPDGSPDPAWKPSITSAPSWLRPGNTYTLHGRQINGLSQASMYGDDATMATNYPIVRLTNRSNNHVTYCRTHDFSTMGVATGTVVHAARFTVPAGTPYDTYDLCVIANGISSECRTVSVTHKFHKDLKWEIKEINDKENLKLEIDVVVKREPDIKLKDAAGEGDPWQRFEGDPAWGQVLRTLIERSDKIETLIQKQPFIQQSERPPVGEEPLKRSDAPAGKPTAAKPTPGPRDDKKKG